jgi:hypothetical protein
MSEGEDKSNDPFLRQRRNLIIGALIVLFVETTVSPPDNLSILGVTLKVTNSDYIVYWLWLFTCYWLLRFFQYLPLLETIRTQVVNNFDAYLSKHVAPIATSGLKCPSDSATRDYVHWGHLNIERRFKLLLIRFRYGTISSENRQNGNLSSMSGTGTHGDGEIKGMPALYLNVRAAIDVCVRTPLFTEYFVPVILFIAAALSSMHRLL